MENNKYIIISFNTTTDAMAFEKFCIENKIGGKLISVPKEIDAGCGLAWEIKINYGEVNNVNTDIDNKELNEIKDMVSSNNLKCDNIVVFEKNKKK